MAAACADLQILIQFDGGLNFTAFAAFVHKPFRNFPFGPFRRDGGVFSFLLEDIL
ncbi:hypothetical protein D3C71_2113910 [compost metagenome]